MISDARQIIALWAHPRSMSTAFERVMRERGDCICLHEPFMYDYYVARGVRRFPHFDVEPDRPVAFDDIVAMVLARAESGAVFIKDMAYYVESGLRHHVDLARSMRHVFLIRDPKRTILSYYRLDPDMMLEEIGYEAQWKLYQWLTSLDGRKPLILKAEDVQRHTRSAMGTAWRHMELPYMDEAFEWNSGETPRDWQQVDAWHAQAVDSSTIRKDQRSAEEIDKAFAEIVEDSPTMATYLEHHQPFYDSLASCAWSGSAN